MSRLRARSTPPGTRFHSSRSRRATLRDAPARHRKRGIPTDGVRLPPASGRLFPVPGTVLVGRNAELERVDAFLASAREDVHALAVTGPAGMGETVVWQEGARRAGERGVLVLTARPSGGEVKLAFATVADLLGPVGPETLAAIPPPQRRALESALLRTDVGDAPLDSRAVATGLLSLLRELASSGPIVVAVDDAQWVDAGLRVGARIRGQASASASDRRARLRARRGQRPGTFELSVPDDRRGELEIGGLGVAALHGMFKQQLGRAFPRPVLVDRGCERRQPFLRPRDRAGARTHRCSPRRSAAARPEGSELARTGAVAAASHSDARGPACRCEPFPAGCRDGRCAGSRRGGGGRARGRGRGRGRPFQPSARCVGRLRVGADQSAAAGSAPRPRRAGRRSRGARKASRARGDRPGRGNRASPRPGSRAPWAAAAPSRSRPS